MAHTLADDIFVGFDIPDQDKPFMLDILAAPGTPWDEKLAIYDIGLFSGFEDWNLMLECAASIKDKTPAGSDLEARDVLAFVPRVNEANLIDEKLRKGWSATDQSIKNLAALLRAQSRIVEPQHVAKQEERIIKREVVTKREREDDANEADVRPRQRVKRQRTATNPSTSHYFANPVNEQTSQNRTQQKSSTPAPTGSKHPGNSAIIRNGIATPRATPHKPTHEHEVAKQLAAGQKKDSANALKAYGPQTARDLRAVTPSWRTPRNSPSSTTSSELLSPVDSNRVKIEH